ncbi:hypothetical protein RD871_002487 [Klebsiella pneumoniae]|jgi:predicted amidophosphoribosyltransferase|uniref:hypothetical protein n=1 Tax=Klebsiella pneumoniae complex TaxID=3390273 RepID=UPI00111C1D60|nr:MULTISPECIES: hypothetical protein [Klebsiella]HCI6179547.1 hypothetical protein [Klebsiella quasipneumoniae subsp. quasipneumoniae]HCI6861476.1 hypothetical protein [Klebsiella quasipneumoniae subsp. similipneumoniae]EIX9652856.1 hypothetical protein [Klebsiella pneumoniae]EKZ1430977.1 hypothetical protein [Klebsiella pneumoniae]MBC5257874.1 hypothetical protein [Klebsiella pneumoniae]
MMESSACSIIEVKTAMITCEKCGTEYDEEDGYCVACDEFTPPEGEVCEFCGDKPATSYVQDHPVCDDCYDDAYPVD